MTQAMEIPPVRVLSEKDAVRSLVERARHTDSFLERQRANVAQPSPEYSKSEF
jgi:hypothetical protein